VIGYILRWFTSPQTVTHPSTNYAVHGRESNSRPVDHKSDALTITLPSHSVSTVYTRRDDQVELRLMLQFVSVDLRVRDPFAPSLPMTYGHYHYDAGGFLYNLLAF